MKRREATQALFALLSSGGSMRVWGQPGRAPCRVGELWGGKPETLQREIRAFRERKRELGWSEGREVVYSARFAAGEAGRYDALAKELVSEKVEVIFAPVTERAARLYRRSHSAWRKSGGDAVRAPIEI